MHAAAIFNHRSQTITLLLKNQQESEDSRGRRRKTERRFMKMFPLVRSACGDEFLKPLFVAWGLCNLMMSAKFLEFFFSFLGLDEIAP
jgi:hypothetical protein